MSDTDRTGANYPNCKVCVFKLYHIPSRKGWMEELQRFA